jgi:hypothetical protein
MILPENLKFPVLIKFQSRPIAGKNLTEHPRRFVAATSIFPAPQPAAGYMFPRPSIPLPHTLSTSTSAFYLFESFAASGSGTAAFWLDNVKLTGLKPPQFIPAMSCPSSNHFTLQWTANPDCTCTVLKSTDLVHWSTLVTGYLAGDLTTGTISYIDTVATTSHSFYRITTP